MRLIYAFFEETRATDRIIETKDGFLQYETEDVSSWQLIARLPDTGGEKVLEAIKSQHERIAIKNVETALKYVWSVPERYKVQAPTLKNVRNSWWVTSQDTDSDSKSWDWRNL